jgi:hypothetical protein
VSVAFPETVPETAVIVVVPTPTAVARPDALIVATAELEDCQAKVAVTVVPAAFVASAPNDIVPPTAMLGEDGETTILATAVVSVGPVIPPNRPTLTSPHALSVMISAAKVATMMAGRDPRGAMCMCGLVRVAGQ